MKLQQSISNTQHFSDDSIRRSRQEATKRRAADTKASSERQAALQTELGNTKAQLAKVRRDLWAEESELRKVVTTSCRLFASFAVFAWLSG